MFAIIATNQTSLANGQRQVAEIRALIVESQLLEQQNPAISLRLLENAHHLRPSSDVTYNLARVFNQLQERKAFLESAIFPSSRGGRLALSNDRTKLITWSDEQPPKLRDWSGQLLAVLPHNIPVASVNFLPGNHLILTVSAESPAAPHTAHVWTASGELR